MNIYPADEQRIGDVELGRSCEATVPLVPGESPKAGDTVLFALCISRGGQPPSYVKGGDSVLVSLTDVVDLGADDPVTGQALVRLRWQPPGQDGPAVAASGRVAKARRPPASS